MDVDGRGSYGGEKVESLVSSSSYRMIILVYYFYSQGHDLGVVWMLGRWGVSDCAGRLECRLPGCESGWVDVVQDCLRDGQL